MTDHPPTGTAVPKVVHQLRRARRLADHLTAASHPDPALALDVARDLPAGGWATLARTAGLDTGPSPDTVALAIELVAQRVEQAQQAQQDRDVPAPLLDHTRRERQLANHAAWAVAGAAAAEAGYEFVCGCGRREPHLPHGACRTVLRRPTLPTALGLADAVEPEVHQACGHAHRLNDECVVPADSPRGQLDRALYSTSTDPARALDRLAAVHQLQERLVDEERQAVLGARMAGCDWIQMGEAIGTTRTAAYARWIDLVRRFETAGLLDPQELPPPAAPIDPDLAAASPFGWCRWCGHRLVVDGGISAPRWRHHDIHARAGEGWIDVDCSGPEPWPTEED